MTREQIISKITEMFMQKYGIDISQYPTDTEVIKFAELNDKLDSIEFMNFIFDVEDELDVRDAAGPEETIPTKLGELFDMFETAITRKLEQENKQ
jgi:acyl carrier protein